MDKFSAQDIMYEESYDFEEEYVGVVDYHKKYNRYFPSNKQEGFIVNAVTGVKYPLRVGSSESLSLFRVVDTTGEFDNKGRKLKITSPNYPNPTPNHCYYDNPQQFMTHRRLQLNPILVEKWYANQQASLLTEDN